MKKIYNIVFIIVLIVLILLVLNLKFYGTWNPFVIPPRLNCFNRTYNDSGIFSPRSNVPSFKPTYKLDSNNFLNTFSGKIIFSTTPKGEFVPTVIFLDLGNNKYEVYSLSGGP